MEGTAPKRHAPRPIGVELLDHAVGGAAPKLGLVLVGETGTGRTVLCLEVAAAALDRGQRVVYLTGEPPEILLRQAESLGLDLLPGLSLGRMTLLELVSNAATTTRAYGVGPLLESMEAESPHADWVIVDPLTSLTADLLDERPLRDAVGALLTGYGDDQMIVATADTDMLRRQPALERALSDVCGSLAYLRRDEEGVRSISVLKSRFASGAAGKLTFEIGASGTSLIGRSPSSSREVARSQVGAPSPGEASAAEIPVRRIELDPALRRSISALERVEAAGREVDRTAALPTPSAPLAPRDERDRESPSEPRAEPDAAASETKRKRILVVHGDSTRAAHMAKVLEPTYEVAIENTAFGALSAIFTQPAALIVLDVKLPDISGYEFLATLRRSPNGPPVLAVSESLVRAGDRIRALVLGASDVLPSFSASYELRHKVESLLRVPHVPTVPAASPVDVRELVAFANNGSRQVDQAEFGERVERANRFGEKFGIASSLLALEAGGGEDLEIVLAACEKLLRTEDAMIQLDERRALVLLVAASSDSVPVVVGRIKKSVERMVDLAWGARLVGEGVAGHDGDAADWEKFVDQLSMEVW